MLSLLVAAALVSQQPTDVTFLWCYLGDPALRSTRLSYAIQQERMDPPKTSPKKFGDTDPQPYEFDWQVVGYAKHTEDEKSAFRKFRVFSQERKAQGDRAPMVARMLLRLWDLDYKKYKYDHAELYNNGTVDTYLCWGGKPGGEQRFDADIEGKPPTLRKVDTIYIYDLSSFTDPVEMAREVCHEYGHAVLPPVGGFGPPEDWANGDLGEHLFLKWVRDEIASGRITPDDAMGASLKGLDAWIKKNNEPLILSTGLTGPQFGLLEGQGQAAIDAFVGLALYCDAVLPANVVGRALKLIGSQKAKDFPGAIVLSCAQSGRVVVDFPESFKGQDAWLPIGDGTITGAKVVKKVGEWALVRPQIGAITLVAQ